MSYPAARRCTPYRYPRWDGPTSLGCRLELLHVVAEAGGIGDDRSIQHAVNISVESCRG
jgi:hypothetical protein